MQKFKAFLFWISNSNLNIPIKRVSYGESKGSPISLCREQICKKSMVEVSGFKNPNGRIRNLQNWRNRGRFKGQYLLGIVLHTSMLRNRCPSPAAVAQGERIEVRKRGSRLPLLDWEVPVVWWPNLGQKWAHRPQKPQRVDDRRLPWPGRGIFWWIGSQWCKLRHYVEGDLLKKFLVKFQI